MTHLPDTPLHDALYPDNKVLHRALVLDQTSKLLHNCTNEVQLLPSDRWKSLFNTEKDALWYGSSPVTGRLEVARLFLLLQTACQGMRLVNDVAWT